MRLIPLRNWSLQTRVALFTLITFLVSMWALAFYVCHTLRQDLERIAGQQQFSTVSLVADDINHEIDDRLEALKTVASRITPALMRDTAALQTRLENHEVFQNMFNAGTFVTGPDGVATASVPLSAGRAGVSYAERDCIEQALQLGKTTVGRPVLGLQTKAPMVVMATPIHDGQGRVIGALMGVTHLAPPNFLEKIASHAYGHSGSYLLIDRQERVIISTRDKARIMRAISNDPMVNRFVAGYEGSGVFVNQMGVEVLSSAKGIPVANWYLALNLPTSEAFAPIQALRSRLLIATLVLSGLACGLCGWWLRLHLWPLLATVKELGRMAVQDTPHRALVVPAGEEVGALVRGFNRVLQSLDAREQALRDSDAFARAVIDAVFAGVAVLDPRGVIVLVNQPWMQFAASHGLVGGPPELCTGVGGHYREICGATLGRAGEPYAMQALTGIEAVLAGTQPYFSLEYECGLSRGPQWFKLNVTPLGVPAGGAVVALHDTTQRKQAELALLAAKAQAEIANSAKSRFLAAASHDLRQPLAALALYTGMLDQAVAADQPKLVVHIRNCVDSLSVLLADLLDVSKLDAGVVQAKAVNFSFTALCDPLLAIHRAKAEKKGLQLRYRPSPVMLHTDPQLLHRIVGNLIDNAVQYTQRGGVLVAARRHAGRCWLEVWDTGVGIPLDQQAVVFEEFRQLGDASRNHGSGLGLAIVAKAAALLGLPIRLHSRPGRGSRFAIALPEAAPPAQKAPAALAAVPPSALAGPQVLALSIADTLTIAAVDDNPMVLQAQVLALQGLGHTVFGGTSGTVMRAQLGRRVPDMVISDYRLSGGETGFDVIEAARAEFGHDLPAILLTGDTAPDLIRSMTEKGIAVYFKPVPITDLQRHIQQAMEAATT